MRRQVDLPIAVQKKAVSIAMNVVQELGNGAARFRQRFGIDPMHGGMDRMSMGYLGVVRCSFVVAGFVMLGGLLVMFGYLFVVFRHLLMKLLRSMLLRCFPFFRLCLSHRFPLNRKLNQFLNL